MKTEKEVLMDRHINDARIHTYRNLRRAIVKNIDILKKLDKAGDVYGIETDLVYENMSFILEQLFLSAFLCNCINGPDVNEMSHLNYMSVKYCENLLQEFDDKYVRSQILRNNRGE